MRSFRTLTRAAGLALCAAVFAGSALANPGNGKGNGDGGTPPGQERKAEQQAATTPAATSTAHQAPAPGQGKKAEPKEAKAEAKTEAKTEAKAEEKTEAEAKAKAKAKSEAKTEAKAEEKTEPKKQPGPPANESNSGSYKNTSSGTDLKKGMSHKHTICHATGSESNPYVVITPSVSGVYHGHLDHQGDEDIVPPFTYKGVQYSQNWDAAGQAIFANGCRPPAATPTPPPHQQTDVCPNLEGMQTTVPTGLVKDASGNCVRPPHQQTDVCPNIEGMQTTVPTGLVKDASGNCVHPPHQQTDVCPNLDGMQTTVPTGLVKDAHGNCVAPAAVGSVQTTTVEHETLERHDSSVATREQKTENGTGATSPTAAAAKAGASKRAEQKPASGVLGAVKSADESIAATATTGTLPFTGIPLWLVAILGGGLLAGGFAVRRAAQR